MPPSSQRRRHDTAGRGERAARLFVDSSAWLAFVSRSDGRHADAARIFDRVRGDATPLLTTTLVLAEVHRLILHRAGVRPATAFLRHLDATPAVELVCPDRAAHEAARQWIDRLPDHPITYTDAVSFAVMQHRRVDAALTFDRHFVLAGFRTLPA